jgi:hypothetical protein
MNLYRFDRDRLPALLLAIPLSLLCGCGASSNPIAPVAANPAPLAGANINLIFVVSPDLKYQASGDVDPKTANLTAQGLQRTLLLAPFLQQKVLGGDLVTAIYALEPMTHLQTASNYPDIAALETVQQFSMINQFSMLNSSLQNPELDPTVGNNFPINVSYGPASVPNGVVTPSLSCTACQGIEFNGLGIDNQNLLNGIVSANLPGFYVFSAPWETTKGLLANLNTSKNYNLSVPSSYQYPNNIYAIAIAPSGSATLKTYNSNLKPPTTYPVLDPGPVTPSSCEYSNFTASATKPLSTINTNETLYFIRHANAHPSNVFSDGNYVAQGQWRALDLGNAISAALKGRPQPSHVYSLDPAQVTPNAGLTAAGPTSFSHSTLALTAEPYAIAANLPYSLVSNFLLTDTSGPQEASNYFFQGGQFSNQTILVAWEHTNIPEILYALLGSYGSSTIIGSPPVTQAKPLTWNAFDYDSIWTVTIDANGNLTADNSLCEGINSDNLPASAPTF